MNSIYSYTLVTIIASSVLFFTDTDAIAKDADGVICHNISCNENSPSDTHQSILLIKDKNKKIRDSDFVIRKQLMGFNSMYWVDTDIMLRSDRNIRERNLPVADSYYSKVAKELGVGYLRFPGGTASQNYNWITNRPVVAASPTNGRLNQPKNLSLVQPASMSEQQQPDNLTDYREFTKWAYSIGADVAVAVNMEGVYHAGDEPIAGLNEFNAVPQFSCPTGDEGKPLDPHACYVKLAVEWVYDANIRDSGLHRIEYWDLGNESYGFTRAPYGAADYAADACQFYRAMKTTDPSLRIGIIGPPKYDDSSAFDKFTECAQLRFRRMTQVETRRHQKKGKRKFIKWMNKTSTPAIVGASCSTKRPRKIPWWPTVLKNAKGCYDYVAVHKFDPKRNKKGGVDLSLSYGHVGEWSRIFDQAKRFNPDAGLSINAWSLGNGKHIAYDESEFVLSALDFFEDIVNSGAESAAIWPWAHNGARYSALRLEFKGSKYSKAGSVSGTKKMAAYDLYRILSELQDGVLLETEVDSPDTPAIAVAKNGYKKIVIRNKLRETATVKIQGVSAANRINAGVWDVVENRFKDLGVTGGSDGSFAIKIPPISVVLLTEGQ